MIESQHIPAGGMLLKAMLLGFVLGFVLMGAARDAMPVMAESLAFERSQT